MICDLCKQEYVVLGGVRPCRCTCGGEHTICRLCRKALVKQRAGRYDKEPKGGFFIKLCPTAVEVAKQMMRDGDKPPPKERPLRLSMEAKIDAVERKVMDLYLEGSGTSLTCIANSLGWHTSKVRSAINKTEMVSFRRGYGRGGMHFYKPSKQGLIKHIKDLRAAVLGKEESEQA